MGRSFNHPFDHARLSLKELKISDRSPPVIVYVNVSCQLAGSVRFDVRNCRAKVIFDSGSSFKVARLSLVSALEMYVSLLQFIFSIVAILIEMYY